MRTYVLNRSFLLRRMQNLNFTFLKNYEILTVFAAMAPEKLQFSFGYIFEMMTLNQDIALKLLKNFLK